MGSNRNFALETTLTVAAPRQFRRHHTIHLIKSASKRTSRDYLRSKHTIYNLKIRFII